MLFRFACKDVVFSVYKLCFSFLLDVVKPGICDKPARSGVFQTCWRSFLLLMDILGESDLFASGYFTGENNSKVKNVFTKVRPPSHPPTHPPARPAVCLSVCVVITSVPAQTEPPRV